MVKGIRCDYIDLNQKLPYGMESFDYVMCIEVIEHLENPHHIVREIARVLRPRGKVVLSTPNIANFYSRLYFLRSGFFHYFLKETVEGDAADSRDGSRSALVHIRPVFWWELEMCFAENKLLVEKITMNDSVKPNGVKGYIKQFLYLLLSPFLQPRDPVIMKGAILIVKARKHP